ncbi:hypothetical protein [Caballeronia sp. KNU42]
MSEVIAALQPQVPDIEARKMIYRVLVVAFENMDWDTQMDCMDEDPAFDAVIEDLHPQWFEDDDDD